MGFSARFQPFLLRPGGLVTISAGNTLTLGSASTVGIDMSQATAGLTLNCNLALGNNNTFDVTNGQTLTVGGVISGTPGITKQGGGSASLSGANTYTGSTTVNGGLITLSGANTLAGAITVNAGELDLANTAAMGTVAVGTTASATGTFGIWGCTLNLGAISFFVGGAPGAGMVNQTNGTVSFNGGNMLLIGNGATGTYNLSGGTITSSASSASLGVRLGVNPNANATFNLSGTGNLSLGLGAQIGRAHV